MLYYKLFEIIKYKQNHIIYGLSTYTVLKIIKNQIINNLKHILFNNHNYLIKIY